VCERLLAAVCVYVGATALASESIRLENLLHAGGTRLRFYPRGDRSHPRLCRGARAGEAYSDVAPAHVHDPDTMIMRQIAEQASLIRWDDERARYVLTVTGRRRIIARRRTGVILRFPVRGDENKKGSFRNAFPADFSRW